jgi:NADPH:quinone reductase-like Zn-dependent oxidoreductase
MKAIVQERFGPPDTMELADIEVPVIGPGEVLIEVHAAALNPYDWHVLRGDPRIARLLGGIGLTRPKARVAGVDVAGLVTAVGADVRDLAEGDAVFGFGRGSFAEYAVADAARVVPMPEGLSFEQAAAVPMAAVTALHGIRDTGRVRAGQRVLVNGAAGGVGSCAVQIAAALGAEVTGVCSAGNVETVRGLGAVHVVDYTQADFTDATAHFDMILDNVGNRSLGLLRRALTPSGTLVLNGGGSPGAVVGALGSVLRAAVVDRFVAQRICFLPATWSRDDLLAVSRFIEDGRLTPVIDRTYALVDVADGLRYVEQGHARGKVVVTVT